MLSKKFINKLKPKEMVYLTHKTTISINSNTENVNALNATNNPK